MQRLLSRRRERAGKHFTQEKNCEKIVFGYDDVMNRDDEHPGAVRSTRLTLERFAPSAFWIEQPGTLIIVEGEMDKLACNEVRSLLCVCCVRYFRLLAVPVCTNCC